MSYDPVKTHDWWETFRAWERHMYYEAADRGYDFTHGPLARDKFYELQRAYEKKHGEPFSHSKLPADVDPLGPSGA